MKYYETTFEDYISTVSQKNYHKELIPIFDKLPDKIDRLQNIIFYGPSGSGKYSQVLMLIKKYSINQNLKFDKMTLKNEKQSYNFHISDIHYEIDMSLLGCHSKTMWYDVFLQIIEVVSTKQNPFGIIICKNFHNIHNELLEIFYSYMQKNHGTSIIIKFILITENISFIPNNIIQSCQIIRCKKPDILSHLRDVKHESTNDIDINIHNFRKRIQQMNHTNVNKLFKANTNDVSDDDITNIKDTKYLSIVHENIPKDIFNVVCDDVINLLIKNKIHEKSTFLQQLREVIYEMFTYNLDVSECVWYILSYLISHKHVKPECICQVTNRVIDGIRFFNNNYRPIYHLENILLSIAVVLNP
jgi:DNA polymerase III delta prime subunit